MHRFWTDSSDMGRAPNPERNRATPAARALYCDAAGEPLAPGAFIRNPDLANSLRRIAEAGPDIFYSGAMADEIDADMKAHGGLLSAADLAADRTTPPAPPPRQYRGPRMATNQPPGGGILRLQLLNIS